MRIILLFLVSIIIVGTIGFFVGRLVEREVQLDTEQQVVVIEKEVPAKRAPAPEKEQAVPETTEAPPTDTAALVAAAAKQLSTASVSQAGAIEVYQLVGKLQPVDIATALAEIEALPHGQARQSLAAAVVARWAALDGRAAMDYTFASLSHANRPAALGGALSAWSDSDPAGALEWYHAKVSSDPDFEIAIGAKPAYLLPTIFEGLVAEDISTAYAAFSRLGSIEEKDQALDGIAAANLTNVQVHDALELASTTLGDAASAARLRLVSNWGQRDPAAAAEWVSSVRDPNEKAQFARSVAQTWIAYEPATAVPWLLENTPQAERPTVVELATSIWVNSDPNATAEWLSTIPKGKDSDLGVSTLSRHIVAIEPEAALGWAKTIENDTMRRQTLIAVFSQWRFREPERAVESLKSSGLPQKEIEDYLLRTVPAK